MKKILYSILGMLTLCASFTSCGDDDSPAKHSQLPEVAASGTYSGTWEVGDGTDITATEEGSVEVSVVEGSSYVASITLKVPNISDIDGLSAVGNCAWSGNAQIINVSQKNGTLNEVASCRIEEDGTMIGPKFVKSVKVGKKTTVTYYSFKGHKALK